MFAAPRQSHDMYDTILGSSIDKDCLYVGFIGAGAIWQNLSQVENSESWATLGGYFWCSSNRLKIEANSKVTHGDVS